MSDPTHIQPAGQTETGGDAHGIQVVDKLVYVADLAAGFQVFDLGDPRNPLRLNGTTSEWASHIKVVGSYAYVAGQ